MLFPGNTAASLRYCRLFMTILGAKSAMAKATYGHSTQKSAMAMAIVASPVDPSLGISYWNAVV